MKNTTIKFLLYSIVAAIFFGCTNESINETEEENIDPELLTQQLDDLYARMYIPGSGGTDSHFDFGQKTCDMFTDILISEMTISENLIGWPEEITRIFDLSEYVTNVDATHIFNEQVWNYYYGIIEGANDLIAILGGSDFVSENEIERHFLGQVLTLRAYSYFYLTQFMANDHNSNAEILPLYTEDSDQYLPKSSTSVIFQLIESDLNSATQLLENYNRPNKKHVNQIVAQAILAYAIAAQEDVNRLNEVVNLCNIVIANSSATVMTNEEVVGGFNSVNIPGWIWGVDLTYDMNIGLVSWWGHVDFFSYSYGAVGVTKSMNENLFSAILEEDVRKSQFFTTPGGNYLQPLFKFYDEAKVPFGTSTVTESDYIFMRIAEIHLLKAESLAKLGQDASARDALLQVLDYRDLDTSYINSLSGQVLQDEIYLQTRIELWGEGKAYLALKRNNEVTGARGENHGLSEFHGQSFLHNDERLSFEIPQSVIDSNPFINDQN